MNTTDTKFRIGSITKQFTAMAIMMLEEQGILKVEDNLSRQFLWEKFEHNESVIVITLEEETKVAVGFTQLYPSFSSVSMKRIWILNDLYVREKFRGNQIGRRLLEAAKEYAILTKAKRIELTTARTNLKAQGLYEMNGYEVDEIFYNYLLTI